MSQAKFLSLVDENMSNAVAEQLQRRGVDTIRVIDVLPTGTKDDRLQEYAYQHGYTLLTHDENIRSHIDNRPSEGKEHCGVFIAPNALQGPKGIGRIVEYVTEYDELIKAGAATL